MKSSPILAVLLVTAILIPGTLAADHTIQFQNHCLYEVSVVIIGGLEFKNPGTGQVYIAIHDLPAT
ncbi:hypothetical protein, partial [Methanoregula sp.]|uniref:hypothetical protein n=1 Tax=Methanoregula sp. TaxID=2052170 RepID=UPI000CBE5425